MVKLKRVFSPRLSFRSHRSVTSGAKMALPVRTSSKLLLGLAGKLKPPVRFVQTGGDEKESVGEVVVMSSYVSAPFYVI